MPEDRLEYFTEQFREIRGIENLKLQILSGKV